MGWILRNFDCAGWFRWDSEANPYTDDGTPWPWLTITGLADEALELVWFDDRRGVIIGRQPVSGPDIQVELPDMDPYDQPYRQFFKSLAFVIQPPGYTPDKNFAELPNGAEPIGQILIDTVDTGMPGQPIELPTDWHEESARFNISQPQPYRYVVRTKPPIDNPNSYYYRWYFDGDEDKKGYGMETVSGITIDQPGQGEHPYRRISVEIFRSDQCLDIERVSGDTVYVDP